MADLDYYGADYGLEEPSRFMEAARNFGLANWAGAITSLGLTAGLSVWAVDTTMRDVSGVPVIAALEGPMREAPRIPAARVAPFQGLALSDITSGGPAAPAPDQIVLAPPPVSLDAPALSERIAAAGEEISSPAGTGRCRQTDACSRRTARATGPFRGGRGRTDRRRQRAVARLPAPVAVSTEPVAPAAADIAWPGRPRARRRPLGPPPRPSRDAPGPIVAAPATLPTEAPVQAAGTQVASLDPVMPTARDADPAALAARHPRGPAGRLRQRMRWRAANGTAWRAASATT